ncbi:MAG: DNA polymerase III subunit gamma/tau [Gammaproteobacteria bacterium]|nr:DNA polymerase III subunit gamma/tau [Gammaproteobacteria bacterium]
MSYQALARKWRPKTFDQVIGQDHVVSALSNALNNQRVHHAFLFTGTRGVGKTTLARIFAKALNCEKGVNSTPCDQCVACCGVDQGNFIDLIEVDAASRTKVDDTRELLDNVQYKPTQGRYKIYLIDEVHMLSTHSFNALLKTLEEPPSHVKFLLATTDPQKLPTTILSRCIQFNLKSMDVGRLNGQLEKILEAENIPYDGAGLMVLARSANGSVRDALSLLDQAIAFGNGEVRADQVRQMLGMIDESYTRDLLELLCRDEATKLLQVVGEMAQRSVDFSTGMDELLTMIHNVSLFQVNPEALEWKGLDSAELSELAEIADAGVLQLFYQIALLGKRDLPLAPDPRTGFEMALLRMLAFKPEKPGKKPEGQSDNKPGQVGSGPATPGPTTPGPASLGSATPGPTSLGQVADNAHPSTAASSVSPRSRIERSPGKSAPPMISESWEVSGNYSGDYNVEPPMSGSSMNTQVGGAAIPSNEEQDQIKKVEDAHLERERRIDRYLVDSVEDSSTSVPPGFSQGEERDLSNSWGDRSDLSSINGQKDNRRNGGYSDFAHEPFVDLPQNQFQNQPQERPQEQLLDLAPDLTSDLTSDLSPDLERYDELVRGKSLSIENMSDINGWNEFVDHSGLVGMAREIVMNMVPKSVEGKIVTLSLDISQKHLFNANRIKKIETHCREVLDIDVAFQVDVENSAELGQETPSKKREREKREREAEARAAFIHDPNVQEMVDMFDARVMTESIRSSNN